MSSYADDASFMVCNCLSITFLDRGPCTCTFSPRRCVLHRVRRWLRVPLQLSLSARWVVRFEKLSWQKRQWRHRWGSFKINVSYNKLLLSNCTHVYNRLACNHTKQEAEYRCVSNTILHDGMNWFVISILTQYLHASFLLWSLTTSWPRCLRNLPDWSCRRTSF